VVVKKELVDGVNICTNDEYHSDRKYLSSSVLKTVNKSLDLYHLEYILGQKKEVSKETQAIFDYGTLCHSYILEPNTVSTDFNFFPGFRKAGKEFEDYKAALTNPRLPIISASQNSQVLELIKAYSKHPVAPNLVKDGFAEYTVCGELFGCPIKVRTDYLNIDKGYIVDVKSSGYSSDQESFKLTVDGLQYHLSAALYLQMLEKHFNKPFEFYFLVLSKKDKTCDVFKLSKETREKGELAVRNACDKYRKAKATGIWTDFFDKPVAEASDEYEILEV
jgi:hypothetical protein